ncbi:hypothetical protein, partial [Escherichia coli]
ADQWLLQGQASCSVQSSDVLIVLPRDNSTVAGFDGQSSAVNVLGLVAMTLAVALRQALAGVLGISGAELGYSVRPVRLEDGQSVLAVQLYDVISGGAGFASSAPVHIEA